jgi:hypothetical protein
MLSKTRAKLCNFDGISKGKRKKMQFWIMACKNVAKSFEYFLNFYIFVPKF